MKLLLISLLVAISYVQGQRPQAQKPSDLLAKANVILPAQDITITIHLTSEMATALEKKRVDNFAAIVNTDNSVSFQPKFKTLADQWFEDTKMYFSQLRAQYPGPSVKASQDAAAAAAKAADAAGEVQKK